MSERTKAQLLAENKRLRAEVERLDRIVNPPPPEPAEEPAPKPRLFVLALSDLEKRIVPTGFQIPEAIKSIAPDAEWVPIYRLSVWVPEIRIRVIADRGRWTRAGRGPPC